MQRLNTAATSRMQIESLPHNSATWFLFGVDGHDGFD
jgi:hypothetical protein